MKFIDIESWERKDHYNFFKGLDYPHFSICANLDITQFYKFIKENELPFFISLVYASSKVANSIKEFRLRIREDKVIEHEFINPSFTIMTSKEVFSFFTAKYMENFNEFILNTASEIEKAKSTVNIGNDSDIDDCLYMTSIPWVSFTSVSHPIHMTPADSIPRIAWGKYFEENGVLKLPFSVQVHHALVDGEHVGEYFNMIQKLLNNPWNM